MPNELLPPIGTLGFRVQRYGMVQWDNLFTARQKVVLHTVRALTSEASSNREALSLVLSRMANAGSSLCRWHRARETHEGAYARQALAMLWDYSEVNPFSEATGGYMGAVEWVAKVADAYPDSKMAQMQTADATDHPLPDESAAVWFTDPPYYDAVPYADLSDLFLVWLKRALPGNPLLNDPFDPENRLSPKAQEAVQDKSKKVNGRRKDQQWFEETMARAFTQGRRILQEDGIGSVVFAHKTTEGWEALLSGMIHGGLDHYGFVAHRDGDEITPARARLRSPRFKCSPRVPPATRRCTDRRLGGRASRVAEPCRELDGPPSRRRRTRCRPRLRLCRTGTRDLQSVLARRDRGRTRHWPAGVP